MHCEFSYQNSVNGDLLVNNLLEYLKPKDENEDHDLLLGEINLENIQKDLISQRDNGYPSTCLNIKFISRGTATIQMAKLLKIHSNAQKIENYNPVRAFELPGSTDFIKIKMSPVGRENKEKLLIRCSPDYRGGGYMNQLEELGVGIQSLRIGYDFICRPLIHLLGQPTVSIPNYGVISSELVSELVKPQIDLETRISLLSHKNEDN